MNAADMEALADSLEETADQLNDQAYDLRLRAKGQRDAVQAAELTIAEARRAGAVS